MTLSREYNFGEPMSDEDSLAHYGVKGMKWGVRSGKGKTGVGRTRGAKIDKNDRHIALLKDLRNSIGEKGTKGKVTGPVQRKMINGINRMSIGKDVTKRFYDMQIGNLQDQNARLKAGKSTFRDKVDMALTTTPASLVVSYRPKD